MGHPYMILGLGLTLIIVLAYVSYSENPIFSQVTMTFSGEFGVTTLALKNGNNSDTIENKYPQEVEAKCEFFIESFRQWGEDLKNGGSKRPPLIVRAESHGLGDKLGGIITGFFYAMQHKRPLQIVWPGVDMVFKLPDFLLGSSLLDIAPKVANDCYEKRGFPGGKQCREIMDGYSPRCWKGNALHTKGQRICINSDYCMGVSKANNIRYNTKQLGLAQTAGCAIRIGLKPLNSFLDLKYNWWIEGKVTSMSVREIQQYLSQFVTVAIQMRVGDDALHHNSTVDGGVKVTKAQYSSLECANKLYESSSNVQSVAPRFVFACDSARDREKAKHVYGDKLIMLLEAPRHSSDDRHASQAGRESAQAKIEAMRDITKSTAVEWMILGMADYTILYAFTTIARVSWFPYTSLLWNLRPYAYNKRCERISLTHAGVYSIAFKETYAKTCSNPENTPEKSKNQTNLDFLLNF